MKRYRSSASYRNFRKFITQKALKTNNSRCTLIKWLTNVTSKKKIEAQRVHDELTKNCRK